MAINFKNIHRIKVLGVRSEMHTKLLFTDNYSVYCLLIEYRNGERELIEVQLDKMKKFIPYLDID